MSRFTNQMAVAATLATTITGASVAEAAPPQGNFRGTLTERRSLRVDGTYYDPRHPTNRDTFAVSRKFAESMKAWLASPEVQEFYRKHPEIQQPTIPANINALLAIDPSRVRNKTPEWDARANQLANWGAVVTSRMIDFAAVAQGKEAPHLGNDPAALRGSRAQKGTLTRFLESERARQMGFVHVPLTQNWLCPEQVPTAAYVNIPGKPPREIPFTPFNQSRRWGAPLPNLDSSRHTARFDNTTEEICVEPFNPLVAHRLGNGFKLIPSLFIPGSPGGTGNFIVDCFCPTPTGLTRVSRPQ